MPSTEKKMKMQKTNKTIQPSLLIESQLGKINKNNQLNNQEPEKDLSLTVEYEDDPLTSCQVVFSKVHTSPVPQSKFYIQNVTGVATPGQILAIMGPTGCGKTTVLNAIAGRIPLLSGSILVNGEPISRRIWRTKFGYVLQHDMFFPTLTLKQTLLYTALLRLSDKLSYKKKLGKVESIIDDLDLYKCQDSQVGDDMGIRGLSGGEKKRLSIACELITNPSVLVIDEPTSGLDSFTAIQLIKTLKNFAKHTQKNVILTVHQPSSSMFQMFDNLLALCSGRAAYFGPTSELTQHLAEIGFPMEVNYNPADFLLEKLKYDEKKVVQSWEEYQNRTNNNVHNLLVLLPVMKRGIQEDDNRSNTSTNNSSSNTSPCSWQTSFLTQVKVLTRRNFQLAIPRIFSWVNIIQTVALGLMAGLVWFKSNRTEDNIENLEGFFFFSSNYWMLFCLFQALWSFPPEKSIVTKERKSGAYRLSSYYVSKVLGELPLELALPTLYFLISYLMIGGTFLSTVGIIIMQALASMASQSVGLFFGSFLSQGPATTVASIFTVGAQLLGGYLTTNIPSYLKIFSLVYNGLRNLEIVEYLYGNPVMCAAQNVTSYPSCVDGETGGNISRSIINPEDLLWKDETDFPLWGHTTVLITLTFVFRLLAFISLRKQL